MRHPKSDYGVAPMWEAVDVSVTDYEPTRQVVGLYITGGGAVSFTSGGNDLTVTFGDNQFVTGNFTAVLNSGTTATGIYALYI